MSQHKELSNRYGPTRTPFAAQPRPTQQDVARRAGVSQALVSLVMRGGDHVATTTRDRVLKAADELGYRPNALARSLARRQSRAIGVLINDVSNPCFGGMYACLAREAERSGLDLLVAPGLRTPRSEAGLLDTLLEHQVAGLLLLSPTIRESSLAAYCSTSPTVVIGRGSASPGSTSSRSMRPSALDSSSTTSPPLGTNGSRISPAARTTGPLSTVRRHTGRPCATWG